MRRYKLSNDIYNEFRMCICEKLDDKGMSIKDFARSMSVNYHNLHKFLHGNTNNAGIAILIYLYYPVTFNECADTIISKIVVDDMVRNKNFPFERKL